ncbi:ABC-F family ATP-binding cassette domain-containing protein [Angustibacter luteus]|uniref:ABC-F family ATP-binding cassette domain-containing protein n=1 Tax=Angustibacter luteus TaxID=658456 RepID=A0ABW1JBL4_9ACTN
MSATIVARDLAAGHGARALFSGLDLVVAPGDVVGLVGANGAGKSTLLRLLSGIDKPEDGQLSISPPGALPGYLPQELDRRPGESVRDLVHRRTGVADAQHRLHVATQALTEGLAGADDEYAEALEVWLHLGGADLDERAEQVVSEIGLGVGLDAPTASLSGGEAARAGLACLLLSRYDAYLLDEPTNDLDLAGLAQLEQFVRSVRAPVVVVSHDREFLSRTVNQVVELDLAQQQVGVYGGSYDDYLREREIARHHAREAFEQFDQTRGRLADRARMQRAWADKGTRNALRKATDGDKNVIHHNRETAQKQAAKAKQTDRLIERLDVVEEPRKEWALQLDIAAAGRSGSVVATARGAVVRRGGFTLGPLDLQLDWADRVVVTGPNGSGKSTLLALLLGRLIPDEGSAGLGSGVLVGEVDQARAAFDGPDLLLHRFAAHVPDWPTAEVRTLLAKFGLGSEHVLRACETLSPGERTRAALALLQARGVNLLVLDEPTNHLDLPAIEQLEQALDTFGGTVLLVTHDRRMLSTVRSTRHWALDGGRFSEQPAGANQPRP